MPDVNVLVYAHRADSSEHERYARWLVDLANGDEPFALSTMVMQGFVRVATTQKVFPGATCRDAFEFLKRLAEMPHCAVIRPGAKHWSIFQGLCERTGLKGKMVADAAHAALAIESGCEWVTADTDFARFAPPLRWKLL